MNALTGNTTDLRILAAVVGFLKEAGYRQITIGEGTNSGFYRSGISVIERLKIDRLARHFGVAVKDLNYSAPVPIAFEDGVTAAVAQECVDADLFINLPKLKTHFENGMTVCLKNLMGCLVGQENKKKTHQSLAANILHINLQVKPHLHLVDAVIAMEGLGPTRGTPLKTGMLFAGTDPLLLDLVCARFASFDYRKVRTLAEAERRGLIDGRHHAFVGERSRCRARSRSRRRRPGRSRISFTARSGRSTFWRYGTRRSSITSALPGPSAPCSTRRGCARTFSWTRRWRSSPCRSIPGGARRAAGAPVTVPRSRTACGPRRGERRPLVQCLYCMRCVRSGRSSSDGKPGFYAEQIKQYDEIIRRMA